jgi:hypothetical protein
MSPENSTLRDMIAHFKLPALLQTLWPRLIELWLAAVLVTFFIVRILGSSFGQRILNSLWHAHN